MRRANPNQRRGFTLLELVVAMAMITLVSVVAIPAYYSQPSVTLDNAAILLAQDLRYAQNNAAMIGEDTRVRFDEDGDGYRLVTASGAPIPNPVGGADLVRRFSADAVFEGIRVTRIDGATDYQFRFNRHGFALDPGRIVITYDDQVRVLTLKSGTGLVEIEGLLTDWRDHGI